MLEFEIINELTLKVICKGNDVLFTKAGAFIGGESRGGKRKNKIRRRKAHYKANKPQRRYSKPP